MNKIITFGEIIFDPINKTKKHNLQSSWKKLAIVVFNDDMCDYYSWFLKKRYNLTLNTPLRNCHVSFINDSMNDIKKGLLLENDSDVLKRWNHVKKMWDGKEINIVLDLDMKFAQEESGSHVWLNIPNENRNLLHAIRLQLGLDRPYWGLHMSIGYANDKNIEHFNYIRKIDKFW